MPTPTETKAAEPSFDDLLSECIADPEKISELSAEQVIELRKKISPFGRTIAGDKGLCCLSVVNMKEEYIKRFQIKGASNEMKLSIK